jgi:hypothetical protein
MLVDINKILDLLKEMQEAKIHYLLGAKQDLHKPVSSFSPKLIDCSGFVRYVLYNAAPGGAAPIPDGTWGQNQYFNKQLFTEVDYKTSASLADAKLRIAFARQSEGHVWLIHDGWTIESHSFHKGEGNGPDRRPWNDQYLLPIVAHCYQLT